MSFTIDYTGDPSVGDVAAVRFEIQDTDVNAPLLQDQEIAWSILRETGLTASTDGVVLTDVQIFSSGARCMEALAEGFAAQADTEFGALKTTYTTMASQYATRAAALRAKAQGLGAAPWSGGQSQAEKQAYSQDPDQVQPLFTRSEFNNRFGGRTRRGSGF